MSEKGGCTEVQRYNITADARGNPSQANGSRITSKLVLFSVPTLKNREAVSGCRLQRAGNCRYIIITTIALDQLQVSIFQYIHTSFAVGLVFCFRDRVQKQVGIVLSPVVVCRDPLAIGFVSWNKSAVTCMCEWVDVAESCRSLSVMAWEADRWHYSIANLAEGEISVVVSNSGATSLLDVLLSGQPALRPSCTAAMGLRNLRFHRPLLAIHSQRKKLGG